MAADKGCNNKLLGKKTLIALLLLLQLSAITLIYGKHLNRQHVAELDNLLKERDALQVIWGQLLIEQETLTTHSRVEQLARNKLNMQVPMDDQIVRIHQ